MNLPLSVNLMPNVPVPEVVALGELAEALGYKRCWVYDEGLVTRDVYVTLAAIATRTHRILLGPGITNPYVRHPGATAAAVASLDELSGGRAFVGLGAGGALTLAPLSIERTRPLTAVADTLQALRELFAGRRVTTQSHTFAFDNARLTFGRPDIEIILAGRGPRMTELGGQQADGFYLSYIHKDIIGSHVRALRAAAADRPFSVVYSTMIATSDAEFAEARAALTFRLVDSPPDVKDRIGLTPERTQAIRAALAEGGPSHAAALINDDWVPQFVITGTADECAAELRMLLEAHEIDEFQVPVQDAAQAAPLLERVAAMFGQPGVGVTGGSG